MPTRRSFLSLLSAAVASACLPWRAKAKAAPSPQPTCDGTFCLTQTSANTWTLDEVPSGARYYVSGVTCNGDGTISVTYCYI